MKRCLAVAAVWFGLAGLLAAEELIPPPPALGSGALVRDPPPPVPQEIRIIPLDPARVIDGVERPETHILAPQVLPSTPLSATPTAPQVPPLNLPLSRAQHLHKAARHLDAAGYGAEAEHFRAAADALQAETVELLKQKRAALEQLQNEIAELEAATGQYQQVLIRCRVIEINRLALENLGFNFLIDPDADGRSRLWTLQQSALHKEYEGLLVALHQKGIAKTLAEPTLVTTPGRPAVFRSGGETPPIVPASGESPAYAAREFGVTFEAVPETHSSGELRLDVSIEVSTPDYKSAVTIGDMQVPGINTRRVNTKVELRYGEPLVIGGMISQQTSVPQEGAEEPVTTETETLVILTAEPVHATPIAP
jgi:hypothetical protein